MVTTQLFFFLIRRTVGGVWWFLMVSEVFQKTKTVVHKNKKKLLHHTSPLRWNKDESDHERKKNMPCRLPSFDLSLIKTTGPLLEPSVYAVLSQSNGLCCNRMETLISISTSAVFVCFSVVLCSVTWTWADLLSSPLCGLRTEQPCASFIYNVIQRLSRKQTGAIIWASNVCRVAGHVSDLVNVQSDVRSPIWPARTPKATE